MRDPLSALGLWLRPAAPAERLGIVRVLVGAFALVYVLARLKYFGDLSAHDASQFAPVGIAADLTTPLSAVWTWSIAILTVVSGAAFVAGFRFRLVAPVFFATLLWITTYRSSWGKILHSENLFVLHIGVLAVARSADAIAFDARAGRVRLGSERSYGWALRTMSIVTVLTYLVAGIAKLRSGGTAWLDGTALGNWLAYDALRKIELGSFHSPLAAWLAGRPSLLAVLAITTLVVEVGAPVALFGRRPARAWACLAWGFHVAILASMAIGFFYPLSGVAFASLFALEETRLGRRLSAFAGLSAIARRPAAGA